MPKSSCFRTPFGSQCVQEKKFFRAGLSTIWDPLTRWLPKGVLKQELSDIQVTTIFAGNNFRNNYAMKLIFFLKMRNILCRFQKQKKNSGKI